MTDKTWFDPGEYIGDLHYGDEYIKEKINARLGFVDYHRSQVEIYSFRQTYAFQEFLNTTRKLMHEDDTYLNKMVIALDENTAAYMYDNAHMGFITF